MSTILLVDDDKFLLDMYSMKFVQEGFTVQAVLSARDGLEVLRHGFAPDAMLFDLTMPEMDGYEFLQTVMAEKLAPGALKIALTNQSTDAERQKAIGLGADDFFVKATMIPSEVVNTLKQKLGAHSAA